MDNKTQTRHILARCCRLLVGLLFLLSGFAKAVACSEFANLLAQYGFPMLMWAAPIIVMIEIAAGLCLLLRIYPKHTAVFSMLMVAVFSLAFLYARLVGNVTDCGCFGKLKMLELPPLWTFVRNGVLLLLLLCVWKFSDGGSPAIQKKYAVAVVATLFVACYLCGYSFDGKTKYRKQHPMFERAVSETQIPEFIHIAPDSTYMLFIFSYRCQSCWSYFDNVKRYYDSGLFDNVTVFMGGQDSLRVFHDYFQPAFPVLEMDEKELARIANIAPTMYYIKNDTIKYVIESSVPTFYMFKQNYLDY